MEKFWENKIYDVLSWSSVVLSIIALLVGIVALNMTLYKTAYNEGFNACIEENNLYEKYPEEE